MTSKLRLFLVVVALVLVTSACGGKGPTAPSSTKPEPTPFPGTDIKVVPVPGSETPFKFWVTNANPAIGSTLVAGQTPVMTWTCSIPSGYSVWMSGSYVRGDGSEVGGGGSSVSSNNDCGTTNANLTFFNIMAVPGMLSIKWRIWVAQGRWSGFQPTREPDSTIQQELWRIPAK